MAEPLQQPQHPEALAEHVARLEARLARVEAQLGLATTLPLSRATSDHSQSNEAGAVNSDRPRTKGDELERHFGLPAFTLASVVALTSGLVYLLSLPHPNLPAMAPPVVGIALAASMLFMAYVLRTRFGLLAGYVRGAAMLLLYLATLRFYFFGRQPAIELESINGRGLLVLATLINAALAWRNRSRWLTLLVLVMACATGLVIGDGVFLLTGLPLIVTSAVVTSWRWNWPALLLAAIPLSHATYFALAIGNPILGGNLHYVREPPAAPGMLMVLACFFAAGSLFRPNHDREDGVTAVAALLNCALGYGIYLAHTAAAFSASFVALHAAGFTVFLGVAVLFWTRERSGVSTFFYAITGYVALSMAIIKAAPSPQVFVWLSGQSLVVLATAIWFRSRLIVVANFLIYAAIVLCYVLFVKRETGVSVGFGLVALVSARMLNWQQNQLELKTELMRNAYLFSAFMVLPYALHHLVPASCVALAWIGLAVGYYALNLIVRNQKYRWMGHATLALTAIFLVLAGPGRLDPIYRVASFLALGTVLLIISLTLRGQRT
jgi:hypothetical protein